MTSHAHPARRAARDLLLVAGSAALALLLLVPWAPSFIGTYGDAGFTFMAHVHFARGVPWGTETLHTTGPWAMLRFPIYLRETFPWMLGLHAALALWIAYVLVRVARSLRSAALAASLVAGCLWLFFLSDDSRWFFVLLTFPFVVPDFRERRTSAPLVVGCVLLGLCFHVKGTFLIATVPLVSWLAVCELSARRPPWHAMLFAVSVVAWNALAGSELRHIPGYVAFVIGGTSGNPENFSHLGPLYQPIAFLGLAAVFMTVVLAAERQRYGRLGWVSFLAYGAVVWMVYKTGFARQDTVHASRSFFTLAPFVACYAVFRRDAIRAALASSRRFTSRQLAIALVAVTALLAWPFGLFLVDYLEIHEGEAHRVVSQLQSLVGVATMGLGPFDEFDAGRRARIRDAYPLPDALADGGPVGVYGQLQTPIVAHGFENAPMPVVAAYENWNPDAVEKTVAWIESDAAPRYLLMTSTGHSSETLRALSAHYDTLASGWPTVLVRRDAPRAIRFEVLSRRRASFGARVAVPKGHERDLLRLKIHYAPTWLNRLVSFAYQPVPVYVVLYDGPHVVCRIRVNRLLAEEGLVLATQDFVNWDSRSERLQRIRHALFADIRRPNRMPVAAYRLELLPAVMTKEARAPGEKSWLFPGSTWRWYFEPDVEFTLERIVVEGRPEWGRDTGTP